MDEHTTERAGGLAHPADRAADHPVDRDVDRAVDTPGTDRPASDGAAHRDHVPIRVVRAGGSGVWARFGSQLRTGAADLLDAFVRRRLWGRLALNDLRGQYDRTFLGIWWVPLNLVIHVGLLGLVFGRVFSGEGTGVDQSYFAYYACSYAVWNVIARVLSEASNLWPASAGLLLQLPVSRWMFVLQIVFKTLLIYGMNMVVATGFLLATTGSVGPGIGMFLPATLLLVLNLVWVIVVVSLLCLRFRDLGRFVPNLIFLMYLLTPILWRVEQLGEHRLIATVNPLFHLVELARGPLLGDPVSAISWTVALAMALAGNAAAFCLMSVLRSRIALWL